MKHDRSVVIPVVLEQAPSGGQEYERGWARVADILYEALRRRRAADTGAPVNTGAQPLERASCRRTPPE